MYWFHILISWLTLFNAKLSPRRYWWGPRSQMGKEEVTTLHNTLSPPEWFWIFAESFWWWIFRWAAMTHFYASLIVRAKIIKTLLINHNFWRERTKLNRGPPAYPLNSLPLSQTGLQIPIVNTEKISLKDASNMFDVNNDPHEQYNLSDCKGVHQLYFQRGTMQITARMELLGYTLLKDRKQSSESDTIINIPTCMQSVCGGADLHAGRGVQFMTDKNYAYL